MVSVRLIAYENIIGFSLEDLKDYNKIFYSPIEVFEDNTSNNVIFDELCSKYKIEIGKLFNPVIKLEFTKNE